MSFQNISSDLIHKMMDYMDIDELNTTSKLCKNLNDDSQTFSQKIKKEKNLKNLTDKHTCKNCKVCNYEVDKNFCTDCFLYLCHNCYSVRNSMVEFIKVSYINKEGYNDYKLICHDYCMYRCYKCKKCDTRHQLYLNDETELQTICVDCFVQLEQNEKINYRPVFENDEDWDRLDAYD